MSTKGVLNRFAGICAKRPKAVLAAWALAVAVLVIAGHDGGSSLKGSDILIEGTSSSNAVKIEREHFGKSQSLAVLLKGSPSGIERFGPKAARKMDRMKNVSVLSPWSPNAPGILRPKKGQALLVLQVNRNFDEAGKITVPEVRKKLKQVLPESMGSYVTGSAAMAAEMNRVGYEAVKKSEKVAAPLLLIVLLLVFRSPVAALIPAILGFSVIVSGGGAIALLARVMSLDAMATSMMSMMGLALGIDYSLLIVSRFRDELAEGYSKDEALERTVRTAGRTVVFAGMVVILAMTAAAIIAPVDMMTSATIGVLGATVLALAGSATLLPALLSMLAPHLDRWRIGRKSPKTQIGHVIKRLIRRPVVTTVMVLIPLLAISAPALGLEIGAPSHTSLPEGNPVREDFEVIRDEVGGGWAALFTVVAVADEGPMTERKRLARLDKFQKRLARQKGIGTVLGPAGLNGRSKELRKAANDLSTGQERTGKLDRGIREAQGGVSELRGGLSRASGGAESLERALGQSLDGTLELGSALSKSSKGSRKLRKAIFDLKKGSKEVAIAAKEAEDGSAQVADGSSDFAGELKGSREDLESLSKVGADSTGELTLALQALDRMSVASKSEPEYAEVYERVATALGTLTGQNPRSGQYPESGYYGLESSVARATEQNIAASKEADKMASGASKIKGGVAKLRKGSNSLGSGLDDVYSGSDELTSGLERTREGIGDLSGSSETLVAGANNLKKGTGRLADDLGSGYSESAGLESGLGRMAGDVGQYRSNQGSAADERRQSETIKSGYFLLAGIDSGSKDEKESAAFALNWDRGGSASRIMVVPGSKNPGSGSNDAEPEVMRALDRLNVRLNRMAPKLADDLDAETAVGGRGAVFTDFLKTSKSRILPLLLTLVAVALVVLTVVFRSPLLALKAVVLNMLTVAAAFGVLALVSTGDSPLIGGPGFINSISVYGILAVVFALSIDYEVFLITRMREGYHLTGTTEGAIQHGVDHTARVITGAAAIMIGVFFSFGLADYMTVREFGVGLAVAIFLDATVVRLVLLPATMKLFGPANWWMPRWLDRLLPKIAVEGGVK